MISTAGRPFECRRLLERALWRPAWDKHPLRGFAWRAGRAQDQFRQRIHERQADEQAQQNELETSAGGTRKSKPRYNPAHWHRRRLDGVPIELAAAREARQGRRSNRVFAAVMTADTPTGALALSSRLRATA
jgi:hypothetical protein